MKKQVKIKQPDQIQVIRVIGIGCIKCGTEHEQFKCPAFGFTCCCGLKNDF